MNLYEIAKKTITQENQIIEEWLQFECKTENDKDFIYVNIPTDLYKLQILDAWLDGIQSVKDDVKYFYRKQLPKEKLKAFMEVYNGLLNMAKTAINTSITKAYKEGSD